MKKKMIIFFTILLVAILNINVTPVYARSWYKYFKQDYNNCKEFEYCNILEWHKEGYTGKGVKVAIIDKLTNPQLDFFNGKLKDPFNIVNTKNEKEFLNSHGQKVADVLHQVAPDAEIYMLQSGGCYNINNSLDWCIRNNIQIVNLSRSIFGNVSAIDKDEIAYKKGVFLIKSAGNDGEIDNGKMDAFAKKDIWLTVGATHLSYQSNLPHRSDYSSYGKGLDVMGFSKLWTTGVNKEPDQYGDKYYINNVQGTSFSSPFVAGMIALYNQRFKDENGRFPTPQESKAFVINNCEDLEDKGYDIYTGHGLFILPKLQKSKKKESIKEHKDSINTDKPKNNLKYIEKQLYTLHSDKEGTEWLEDNYYGYLYFDKSKDDGVEYKNNYGKYYKRIAKGYILPMKIGGFSDEALKEKEDLKNKSRMIYKNKNI